MNLERGFQRLYKGLAACLTLFRRFRTSDWMAQSRERSPGSRKCETGSESSSRTTPKKSRPISRATRAADSRLQNEGWPQCRASLRRRAPRSRFSARQNVRPVFPGWIKQKQVDRNVIRKGSYYPQVIARQSRDAEYGNTFRQIAQAIGVLPKGRRSPLSIFSPDASSLGPGKEDARAVPASDVQCPAPTPELAPACTRHRRQRDRRCAPQAEAS